MQRLRTKAAALPPPYRALAACAAVAFLAAGCGGAIPSSDGGPAKLELTSSSLGHLLTDGEGHTLYFFERDEKGESYQGVVVDFLFAAVYKTEGLLYVFVQNFAFLCQLDPLGCPEKQGTAQ